MKLTSACFVLMPAAAVAVLGFSASRAHAVADLVLLGTAAGALAFSHVALRAKSRQAAAAEDERRARQALELQARVGECERRRERLAAFAQTAAHVAHEVRNPLGSIGLNLELLDEELRDGRPQSVGTARDLLRSIQAEAGRLQKLTDEYLAFARPPKPAAHPEDLRDIAQALVRLHREEALHVGVRIGAEVPAHPVGATVDPNLVKQAAINLVRNAIRATPAGGQVTILVGSANGHSTLTVRDTGPGVPATDRCAIFEPFVSHTPGGTGLGLPLAMHIVREHGGELRLDETEDEGTGASFTMSFPAADMSAAGDADTHPREAAR